MTSFGTKLPKKWHFRLSERSTYQRTPPINRSLPFIWGIIRLRTTIRLTFKVIGMKLRNFCAYCAIIRVPQGMPSGMKLILTIWTLKMWFLQKNSPRTRKHGFTWNLIWRPDYKLRSEIRWTMFYIQKLIPFCTDNDPQHKWAQRS